MRFGGRQLLAALALYVLVLFGLPGCSGDQEQDEVVSADDNSAEDEGGSGENQVAGDDNSGDNNSGDNVANTADEGGGETADEGGGETAGVGNGNATENDLQDIIQEMNGQGTGESAGGGANAAPLAQETQTPPPANNAAAMPANGTTPEAAAPTPTTAETAVPPAFQPGGSPAGKGLPEAGSKMTYIVQRGDTLAKISQKIYGNGSRWNELATLSQLSNPSRIFPGDLIYYTLDDSAVPFATTYEAIQRSEEHVKPGDTLASIAKRVYGNSNAWRALWRENDKIDNPDIIPPGTTVYYVAHGAMAAAAKVHAHKASTVAKAHVKGQIKSSTTSKSMVSKAKSAKLPHSVLLAGSQMFHSGMNSFNHLN